MYQLKHIKYGEIFTTDSIENLISYFNSKEYRFPKPIVAKMVSEFQTAATFSYALQTLTVTKK